jgi:hypothetical protein
MTVASHTLKISARSMISAAHIKPEAVQDAAKLLSISTVAVVFQRATFHRGEPGCLWRQRLHFPEVFKKHDLLVCYYLSASDPAVLRLIFSRIFASITIGYHSACKTQ